jgi:hypothetical protein
MFASLTLTAKQSRLFDDRFDPLLSSLKSVLDAVYCMPADGAIVAPRNGGSDQIVKARIELGNRIGKGAIRGRRPDVYQEILEPKQ